MATRASETTADDETGRAGERKTGGGGKGATVG